MPYSAWLHYEGIYKLTLIFMKKKILFSILCCILSLSAVFADGPFRNHRYDSFKVLETNSESIVFIGNSITDMHCWPEAFKTSEGEYLPIVNRGNSGTYSTEQSDNLESYLKGQPKKVFMMIGTNDIATSGGLNFSGEQVLSYIKSIVARINARSPQTKIYLYSILNNRTYNRVEATWLHANELIKEYVATKGDSRLKYIDLYDKLKDVASGGVWSYDNLHLTAAAYRVWCDAICEYLAEGEEYTVETVYKENTAEVQNRGDLSNASHGMRATYFSMMPIGTDDVLVFGDEFIKNGEWQELLGNRNVKNRGTGWGYGGDIATTSKIVDATYAETGVEKKDAKAIFIYTGTGDCNGTTAIETVKANYKELVNKVKEKSPASKIYLMALAPTKNTTSNARISELNTYLQEELATGGIEYVDTYTPLLNGNVANTKYFYPDNYLGAFGYVEFAQAMVEALKNDFPEDNYTAISDDVAEVRYAQANLRNSLSQEIARGLIAERGTGVGLLDVEKMKAFDTKLNEAYELLAKDNITEAEVDAMKNELNSILVQSLSMPEASTADEETWYQFVSLRSKDLYITATGESSGVAGDAQTAKYASSMWKFVARGDGTFDIVNRKYGSYLNPVANYNTQITTIAARPANGWTVSYANTMGYYIISSGEVQLNQTGSGQEYKLYNWSSSDNKGNDRNDTGCQFLIMDAQEVEEEVEEDINELSLTLTATEFAKGQTTWSYHGATTSGVWYGKFVTGTEPSLTAESTDAAANNLGWSRNQPWLQPGYTYNLKLQEGYIIKGYELKTKNVDLSASSYACVFTYTTATGTATSSPQSNTESTIEVTGLETDVISLTIDGEASSQKGLIITKLVIYYEEVAENEFEYTIDKANGNLYRGTSVNQNWNSVWKSSKTPQLELVCGANNMNWVGDNVQLMTGTSGSAQYTVTIPEGFLITEYSFTFANNGDHSGVTLTMDDGTQYKTSATPQTISATKQSLNSFYFTLAGSNGNGVVLTDFTVKVRSDKVEEVQYSTETEKHWYYIISDSEKSYCKGKAMKSLGAGTRLMFAEKALDPSMVWCFEQNSAGKVAVRNYAGNYISSDLAEGMTDTATYCYTVSKWTGVSPSGFAYTIKPDNANPLHAQQSGSVIVNWAAEDNGASLWRFVELTEDELASTATLTSTTVQLGVSAVGVGSDKYPLLRTCFTVSGLNGTAEFNALEGRLNYDKVEKLYLYSVADVYEYRSDREDAVLLGETVPVDGAFAFELEESIVLPTGTSDYYWLVADIADTALEGDVIDAEITEFTVNGSSVVPKSGNPEHKATVFLAASTVEYLNTYDSRYYRIPGITTAMNGWLVAVTDKRWGSNGDLPNNIDVVARVSKDNGKTWTDPVTIAGTAELGGDYGHGDPAIVTDRVTGDIFVLVTSKEGFYYGTPESPARLKYIVSHDNGMTWDAPVDITDMIYGAGCDDETRKTWHSMFFSSGAALQTSKGTLMVVAPVRTTSNTTHSLFQAQIIRSDDHGKTWTCNGIYALTDADESKIVELSDGTLLVKSRNQNKGNIYYATSTDDGKTWSERKTFDIKDSACNGDVIRLTTAKNEDKDRLLLSLPFASGRSNVSVFLSTDEAQTWPVRKTICPGGSAYSTMCVLDDGTIGIYFEEDGLEGGYHMRYVRFSLDWLTDGTDKIDTAKFNAARVKEAQALAANLPEHAQSLVHTEGKKELGYLYTEYVYDVTEEESAALKAAETSADLQTIQDALTDYMDGYSMTSVLMLPEDGKVYRIKNRIDNTADEYKYHYIANNEGVAAFPTTADNAATLWVCQRLTDDNKRTFVSVAGDKFFAWKGLSDSEAANYELSSGVEAGCLAMRANGSYLAVTNEAWSDGGGKANFNQSSAITQKTNWSTDFIFEEVSSEEFSGFAASVYEGSNGNYGTLNLPYAVYMPEGVVANGVTYDAADASNELVENALQLAGNILPAQTPVLLAGEAGVYDFVPAPAFGTSPMETGLKGTLAAKAVTEENAYILAKNGDVIKFLLLDPNDNVVNANKAYFVLDGGNASPAFFSIGKGEGTTAVEKVETENCELKVYDLAGRRVNGVTVPGIYVVDGKKVIIK